MSRKNPRYSNPIYNYFVLQGSRGDSTFKAVCRIAGCLKNHVKGYSTTHYIRHLKTHHRKLYEEKFLNEYTRYRAEDPANLHNHYKLDIQPKCEPDFSFAAQPSFYPPLSDHSDKEETLKELKKRVLRLKAIRLEQLIEIGKIELEMLLEERSRQLNASK